MGIKPALGWLGLFLFAATAEARCLATLARPAPPEAALATLDAQLMHAARPANGATAAR